jgi:GPH family glycoside/pentoside/hexuronide:cation symporter
MTIFTEPRHAAQRAGSLGAETSGERGELLRLVLYGVGDVCNSIRGVLNALFLFFFYTSVMGLSPGLVGLVSGIVLIWDAVIDPYIGHVSDRARNLPLGRRHGLMLVGAVGLGLATFALFSPPRDVPVPALVSWFFVCTALSRLAGALFQIPYYALGVELASEYHARTRLTAIRGVWALLGSVTAASLSFVVFFPTLVPGQDPKLNYTGYPVMGLTLGMTMTLSALVATVTTLPLRRTAHAATEHVETSLLAGARVFVSAAAVAFSIPAFRMLFVSVAFVYLGTVINSVLTIHFLTYFAEVVHSNDVTLVRGAFYGGALLGILIWLRVAPNAEKRQLYLVGTLGTLSVMLLAYVLVGSGRPFGIADPRPLIAGELLAGFTASLFWVIPPSMLADVTDVDALLTGERREGIFFGLVSLGQKLITGVSVLLAGVLVEGYAGLVAGQAAQSAQTAERLGVLFCLLPAALLAIGAAVILPYPLDRFRVSTVQAQLRARRTADGAV